MKQGKTDNRTRKRKIGDVGENIVCKFLVKRGFEVIERNYSKKWGEIDIVARKAHKLHFIEVKSVTRENLQNLRPETDNYRPEDNLHSWKLKRLSRIIQTYLLGYKGVTCETAPKNSETDWQFDVAVVYLNLKNMEAKINYMGDIIL